MWRRNIVLEGSEQYVDVTGHAKVNRLGTVSIQGLIITHKRDDISTSHLMASLGKVGAVNTNFKSDLAFSP
jgi:hypothetical protein